MLLTVFWPGVEVRQLLTHCSSPLLLCHSSLCHKHDRWWSEVKTCVQVTRRPNHTLVISVTLWRRTKMASRSTSTTCTRSTASYFSASCVLSGCVRREPILNTLADISTTARKSAKFVRKHSRVSAVCVFLHISACLQLIALTLLVGRQEEHLACKNIEWWDTGMVICLEQDADDLHMVQLMPLPPHHLLFR